jgi:cell division protein FtsW
VLLLLIAVMVGIGLIAVAAASPAAGVRYSGGDVRASPSSIISTASWPGS